MQRFDNLAPGAYHIHTVTDWLAVKEAAQALGYHPNHLPRLLRKAVVHGRKLRNGWWTIPRREVERVCDLQSEKGRSGSFGRRTDRHTAQEARNSHILVQRPACRPPTDSGSQTVAPQVVDPKVGCLKGPV